MSCKHLFVVLTLLFSNVLIAKGDKSSDQMSYLVSWADGVAQSDKTRYLKNLNSTMLCEFEFGNRKYAWLEFVSFPFSYNGENIIDINSGVTPAESALEIDHFFYDSHAELHDLTDSNSDDCQSSFDLLLPMGSHRVSIFNLDTGVNLPICDNSNESYDFCGRTNCSIDYTNATGYCNDINGHGTHGLGIQQNIINSIVEEYDATQIINIENLTVFDENGIGNLGAILCALADVLEDPSPRKVVNCSFSFHDDWEPTQLDPLFEAFKDLSAQNIFSVTSAGNKSLDLDGPVKSFPACYFSRDYGKYYEYENSTICIGAATCDIKHASYSNYSRENVDVSALGSLFGPDLQSGLIKYHGTSQATFASSVIAAVLMSNQPVVDLKSLKCSMITGAKKSQEFRKRNKARGVLSASGSYERLMSGKPCRQVTIIRSNLTSIDTDVESLSNASIYPNPVSTYFTYEANVNATGQYIMTIVSSTGKVASRKTVTLSEGVNRLKIEEDFDNGTYFIKLDGQERIKNSRFIKL